MSKILSNWLDKANPAEIPMIWLMALASVASSKICDSIVSGQTSFGTREVQYHIYENIYSNCTEVNGPLELSNLELDETFNLNFLQGIVKIRDYLLLYEVKGHSFHLPNLRVIQGKRLYSSSSIYISSTSLDEFSLSGLTEVSRGNISISISRMNYYPNVLFEEIMKSPEQKAEFKAEKAETVNCDLSCPVVKSIRRCWSRYVCQKFSKLNCDKNCKNRCFGPGPLECCHDQCHGGCSGQTNSDCTLCKNFNMDGKCKESCPKVEIADDDATLVENKDGYYSIYDTCVKECPAPYFHDPRSGTCLHDCGVGYEGVGKTCRPCKTSECQQKCNLPSVAGTIFLDGDNTVRIKNCSVIDGNVHITPSFFELPHRNFREIVSVTGYLIVDLPPQVKSLEFLPHELIVRGDNIIPTKLGFSVVFIGNDYFIGNINLKVYNGNVLFMSRNHSLCYYDSRYVQSWVRHPFRVVSDYNQSFCHVNGKICHVECNRCVGPDNTRCLQCSNNSLTLLENNVCMEKCGYSEGNVCHPCNETCKTDCIGTGNNNCKCETPVTGKTCVKRCPSEYYVRNGNCLPCSSLCEPSKGDGPTCSGPEAIKGPNGCAECKYGDISSKMPVRCPNSNKPAPLGFYNEIINNKSVIKPCHTTCLNCTGPRDTDCIECKYFELKSPNLTAVRILFMAWKNCVRQCPPNYYPDKNKICVYFDNSLPILTISLSISVVFTVAVALGCVIFFWRRRVPVEETETLLSGSGIPPNMAVIRTFYEDKIKYVCKIGRGSFGTVYKSKLEKDGKTRMVAVKELDNTMHRLIDFENEIKIMASCNHKHCVKLIGVCMTENIKLIMELCRGGSLFNNIVGRGSHLTPKRMIGWSCQIAEGMNYLEGIGVVHCDLSSRNILIDEKSNAKIADFGLANMIDTDSFYKEGPKFSIRWVAPECLEVSRHSHKSDVWSFGVTIWEILSYGSTPYDHLRNSEIQNFLIGGKRLPHPPSASIDIFMLLYKCWQLHPEQRPSFRELYNSLRIMYMDPHRYIITERRVFLKAHVPPMESNADRSPLHQERYVIDI